MKTQSHAECRLLTKLSLLVLFIALPARVWSQVQSVDLALRSYWPGYPGEDCYTTCVRVVGNYAYLAYDKWLAILDVSNPAQPRCVGYCETIASEGEWFDPFDVEVSGTYALLVGLGSGPSLRLVDVSNPTSPRLAGKLALRTSPWRLQVAGNYAYIVSDGWGDGRAFLDIVEINDPANPRLVGSCCLGDCGLGDYVRGVQVAGSRAYVAAGFGGLEIIDVTSPTSPFVIGRLANPNGFADGLCLVGNHVYLGGQRFDGGHRIWMNYLDIIDVSNAANPVLLGECEYHAHRAWTCDIKVTGPYAFLVAPDDDLMVFDISNPASPVPVVSQGTYQVSGYSIELTGNMAYVANRYDLLALDVTLPANPSQVGCHDVSIDASGVQVEGSHAYVFGFGPSTDSLRVLDVANPSKPEFASRYYRPYCWNCGDGDRVKVLNGRAYLVGISSSPPHGGYLEVIDLRDPTRPALLVHHDADMPYLGIDVRGDYAYVVGYFRDELDENKIGKLEILNVADPSSPVALGRCDTGSEAWAGCVAGQYAYVQDASNGLIVIDVSDPSHPVQAGRSVDEYTWGTTPTMQVAGNYLYQAFPNWGLVVVDVSQPTNPRRVAVWENPGGATDVHVEGMLAYVTGDGVHVIDVSNPSQPVRVASYRTRGSAGSLCVLGDFVYVADGAWGLAILQVVPKLVLSPPVLSGNTLALSWNGGPGIKLQKTTNLGSPVWEDVPGTDGGSSIALPHAEAAAFFRLIQR